jgi:hypothetical protein
MRIKIRKDITDPYDQRAIPVLLVDKRIYYDGDDYLPLHKSIIHDFTYDNSETVSLNHNGKYNTILRTHGRQMFLVHFNRFEAFLLKAMFGYVHFQKHWKFYVGSLLFPLVLFFASKWTGTIDAIIEAMTNK